MQKVKRVHEEKVKFKEPCKKQVALKELYAEDPVYEKGERND